MSNPNVSPYQYEIVSCKIETDRKNGTYEVAPSVAELTLFEHIEKPYISGRLAVLDDANMFENIDFLGTEKVYIKLKVPNASSNIRKTFYVREVEAAINTTDQSQMLLLSIIDLDYYLSSLINLQKKYEGTPSEIIENIIKDNMFWKNILKRDDPVQSPIRFLVPNLTPFGAMQVMRDRSTDDMGSPFYLFASLSDEDLRFFSLRDMLDRGPINRNFYPYRYNQRMASDDTQAPGLAAFNITSWDYSNNENLHKLIQNGDVGATYQYHDPISNLTASYEHSIDAIFTRLYQTSTLVPQAPTYDNVSTLTNKKLHEFQSKVISKVVTSRTFENVNNLHEDNSAAFHREKSVSKSMKNFLMKSTIDITVPGINFLTDEAHMTTGNTIAVEALKNFIPEGPDTNVIDKKKSGSYLIYAAKHSFSGTKYEVTLTCGKLASLGGDIRPTVGYGVGQVDPALARAAGIS